MFKNDRFTDPLYAYLTSTVIANQRVRVFQTVMHWHRIVTDSEQKIIFTLMAESYCITKLQNVMSHPHHHTHTLDKCLFRRPNI